MYFAVRYLRIGYWLLSCSSLSFSGTSAKHMRELLGDGVGTEKPWRGDAEPSHREGIGEQMLPSTHF